MHTPDAISLQDRLAQACREMRRCREQAALARGQKEATHAQLNSLRTRCDSLAHSTMPGLEREQARLQAELTEAEFDWKQAVASSSRADDAVRDATTKARDYAAQFGEQQAREIFAQIRDDKKLRARLLEAYGLSSLCVAYEFGCMGYVRWSDFAAEVLDSIFTDGELNGAAQAAEQKHLAQ